MRKPFSSFPIALLLILLCSPSYTLTQNQLQARAPTPTCRPATLPSIIPVSIGQTVRIDLSHIFQGYNLQFSKTSTDINHITLTPKYTLNSSTFPHAFNFTSAKIKDHNRFLGLTVSGNTSTLVVGMNDPQTGITIDKQIKIQDDPNTKCYDVDEIFNEVSGKAIALIDCAIYANGMLMENQFSFVDLSTYKVVIGKKNTDVFVDFKQLKARNIQIIADRFTNIQYMFRFYTAENVDTEHMYQTYVEIFMLSSQNYMQFQILDVIDQTVLNIDSLAILDYQIHLNQIYLLVKNLGIYRVQFSPTQRLILTAHFPIKMNVNRFRIQTNGFNDDLHLIISNQNTVYQYTWDFISSPILVTKYALMSGTIVQQILMDQDFVIVQTVNEIDGVKSRRTWVFSQRTLSYTNAWSAFNSSSQQFSIILYRPHDRQLHLIRQYSTYNIILSPPLLTVNPVDQSKSGTNQTLTIKATSKQGESTVQCRVVFNFQYILNTNTSIFKTGLMDKSLINVDAPDQMAIDLQYQFFGRNISYDIGFQIDKKSTKVPQAYVQKKVKLQMDSFPSEINQSSIVFFQYFLQSTNNKVTDDAKIYGIVQVQQQNNLFPIYYIQCDTTLQVQFKKPSIKCFTVTRTNLNKGKIKIMSQMYSVYENVGAFIFQDNSNSYVYLYYFRPSGFVPYGGLIFTQDYGSIVSGVSITKNKLLVVVYQYSKKVQIYKLQDLHHSITQKPVPIMTLNSQIMAFFGIQYFAPLQTKISVYHYQVVFIRTKSGILAININQMGFPQLLFNIPTTTQLFDFQVNKDTLLLITKTQMSIYRLVTPLRRINQPYLTQKFTSDFNIQQYNEINSDGLFYLVQKQDNMLLVVHSHMPSTSVIYSQFYIGNIKMIDSVRMKSKQVLFVYNGSKMLAYGFSDDPIMKMRWQPQQLNFTFVLTAYNQKQKSQDLTSNVTVIESSQAYIKPTEKFNQTEILKAGHLKTSKNQAKINMNITLNDSEWFTGNIMNYNIKCKDCHVPSSQNSTQMSVTLQNHIKKLDTKITVGGIVFDMRSTYNGIFGQMYDGSSAIFKTYFHNDSIDYIAQIPTASASEVCSKIIIQPDHDYILSFCQYQNVNVYVTSLTAQKPYTYGPFVLQAKSVNHVQIIGNILMLVDNDDDPFIRSGGVYLYYIDFGVDDIEDLFTMLDYLDYADLQFQGYKYLPYIGSADIHKPLFLQQEYVVFITEARTGNIFVFLFQLSQNKQQAVYLQRRMLDLNKLIPKSVQYPQPLRVININIVDYSVTTQKSKKIQYLLLLTVKNWNHIELDIVFDADYDLVSFELARIYERVPYPWELTNFIRLRKGAINASYFALSYRDYSSNGQVMVLYPLTVGLVTQEQQQQHEQQGQGQLLDYHRYTESELKSGIPITRMLGAYRIQDTAQISFQFHTMNEHRMLFSDPSTKYLAQLQLNRQLKIIIKNAPNYLKQQNITVIAQNAYTNYTFIVQLEMSPDGDDVDPQAIQIIWIVILGIGVVMVIGLVFVWSRQRNNKNKGVQRDSVTSLLTVQPDFKASYINRDSAEQSGNGESERGTVGYVAPVPVDSQEELGNNTQNNKTNGATTTEGTTATTTKVNVNVNVNVEEPPKNVQSESPTL